MHARLFLLVPLLVPLAEEGWGDHPVTDRVAEIYLRPLLERRIEALILGCTHYPLLIEVIKRHLPPHIEILEQGRIVSEKLVDYLKKKPDLARRISRNGQTLFRTTEYPEVFESKAALFMGHPVKAENAHL